ncbi:FKBP-type peptidyl-prolyl cis-trans isomerase [Mucilaginibacter terrae]|uniref:FKBP-type peptidyl-prolyl cis-trans isomerase n=1 Tax=Mucilaginibacter terrae TaxID=1955052 RepID=UPI00363105EA
MKKLHLFAIVGAIFLYGCSNGFKPLGAGSSYEVIDQKSGTLIKEGDFVSVHGQIKTDNDSLISSTYDLGRPTTFILTKSIFRGDLTSAFNQLSEGDSAIIKMSVDSMMKKMPGQQKPPFKSKFITYFLRVNKVIPKKSPQQQAVFSQLIIDYQHTVDNQLKSAEPSKIGNYVAEHHLKVTKTASGLRYAIEMPGDGPMIVKGDTAVINYVAKFTNNKVYGTNLSKEAAENKLPAKRNYEPVKVAVGAKQVISGWDEGLLHLRNKSKSILILPSKLAYDKQGNGPIPPYTPLVFEIQVVNVIHPKKGI